MENKIIAVCTTNLNDDKVIDSLGMIQKEAAMRDWKIVVICTTAVTSYQNPEVDADIQIFKDINYSRFDGIIMFSEYIKDDETLNYIAAQGKKIGIPVLSFERKIKDSIAVMVDYVTSFEKLVRHIIEEHRVTRVDFMSGIPDNEFSLERENVYKKVLRENGIEVDDNRIAYGYFWEDPCREASEKLLAYDIPEAIICANDVMAITVCNMVREKGYRVPEDVIVTGFDGIPQAKWNEPRLTTCGADFRIMAQKMMSIISDYIRGEKVKEEYSIPYEYELGGSCGCLNAHHNVTPEMIFEYYNFNRRHSLYQMNMYQMQAEMSRKDSAMQIAHVLHSYMPTNGYVFVDDNIPEFSLGSKKNSDEKNNLVRVLVKKYENEIEIGTVISMDDIVPNFEAELSISHPLVIMPIHSITRNMGYFAFSMPMDKISFAFAIMYNHATGNALDTFKTQKYLLQINRKLEEVNDRMAELYIRDPLTKLFNRRGFYNSVPEMLKSCYAKGLEVFTASIDLDELKSINDTYGHAEGDNAIKTFGNALLVNADKDDVCARFGGDEFVVVGFAQNAEEAGKRYIKSVEAYLNNYNRDSGKPYKICASTGIVFEKPDGIATIDEYIMKADRIMYQNKKERKAFRSKVRAISSMSAENKNI